MDDKLLPIYETQLAHYGALNWWPAKTPYEVLVDEGASQAQEKGWY